MPDNEIPDDFPKTLFRAVECQRFGAATCFLCGQHLGAGNRTKEHVFAKWLLNRFRLWDDTLTLLNGTGLPYRQLTVPCCPDCNSIHLASIESRVEAAVGAGPSAVAALPTSDIAAWLGKIAYGILYKEGSLRNARGLSRSGPILSRDTLKEFEMHHYFLQSVRIPMKFDAGFPASLFVFEVQEPGDVSLHFDFRDAFPSLAVSIRMGRVGILAALQDCGAMLAMRDHLSRYQAHALHPIQFLELSARFLYKSRLQRVWPGFILEDSGTYINVRQRPLGTRSRDSTYAPWIEEDYLQMLAFHTGLPAELFTGRQGGVGTYLDDDHGNVRSLTLEEQPFGAKMVREKEIGAG